MPSRATATLQPRARRTLAWALWLTTMAACAAGLVVALLVPDGRLRSPAGGWWPPPSPWRWPRQEAETGG